MHFDNRTVTWTAALQSLLAGVLLLGLGFLGGGCDSVGGSDGDGSDTTGTALLDAPSSLSSDADSAEVRLSWLEVNGADSYNVYRALNPPEKISAGNLVTDVTSTSYEDTTVSNGNTYYYVVTALDADSNQSNPSDVTQSTPFADPSDLTSDYVDFQVELEWTTAAGAESYNVYRSTTSTDEVTGDPLASGLSDTTYTDESVETETTYYYRVTSVNPEEEESAASGEVSVDTPLPAPANLAGESGDATVELTWEAVDSDELEGYNLYRDTESIDNIQEREPVNDSPLTETSYTDESVENRTTYYYVVTSVSTDGNESQSSNEVEKTPFSDPPGRP